MSHNKLANINMLAMWVARQLIMTGDDLNVNQLSSQVLQVLA
jgi:hypothetical protein